jgi:hypothetical protein
MPRYSAYGARDDRVQEDGDRGFVGFNNQWEVRKGIDQILTPVTTTGALVLPFGIVDTDTDAAIADPDSNSGNLVITNITGSNYNTSGRINLSNISGITPDPNGNQDYTKTATNELTVSGSFTGNADASVTVKYPILNDNAVEGIYGSCAFSDPNDDASQFIVLATNTKAIAFNLETLVSTDIAYPTGITVSSEVDMIQAFNKVFIFRDGQTALEWDGNTSNDFTKVTSGDYTQPVQITGTITTAGGICTVTASTHGLDTGDTVHVEDKAASNLEVGESYVITKVDANTFTIFVQHPNETNTPNVIFQERVSVGLGFTHMPAPPFAIYHQRRLVMPFNYTVNASSDSFTANGKLDELIASDILDTDTYDQIYANFRLTADFIVGLHSFSEDVLLVFNRNSIHIVANSQVLNNATSRLLTDEIGCLARKSIQQIGNQILFLSDNGVYGVSFLDEYNLRGTELPLSEAIDATIQRINKTHQSKAVSVYFDNRYYLAVPLDNSQENNAIVIYNFLNQQWESIDTVGTEGFHITNMFVAGDGNDKGVYVVNDLGGVNRLESRVDGNDNLTTVIGGSVQNIQVPGSVKTRQFTFNNLDRKKWRSFEMHVESQPDLDSNFDIDGELENLDRSIEIGTLRGFNGDSDLQAGSDVSIRGRLGNPRAYGIQLDINNIVGRPKLRAVSK